MKIIRHLKIDNIVNFPLEVFLYFKAHFQTESTYKKNVTTIYKFRQSILVINRKLPMENYDFKKTNLMNLNY